LAAGHAGVHRAVDGGVAQRAVRDATVHASVPRHHVVVVPAGHDHEQTQAAQDSTCHASGYHEAPATFKRAGAGGPIQVSVRTRSGATPRAWSTSWQWLTMSGLPHRYTWSGSR